MKTITTTLPVYDKLSKQCFERVKNASLDMIACVKTPRHRLPSMEWNVETDNPGTLCSVRLINIVTNAETELMYNYFTIGARQLNLAWANVTNAGYDVFASANGYEYSATKTTAPDVDYVYSDDFSVTAGKSYLIYTVLTLNSGVAPEVYIVDNAGVTISNVVRVGTGIPWMGYTDLFTYVLRVTATDANARIRFRNNATEVTDHAITFYINETSAPSLYSDLTDEYFQYKGDTLSTLLSAGFYYLKFTTVNGYVYYSDIFEVDCIYSNLIRTWVNYQYETFASSGTAITSAIETGANGQAQADDGTFDAIIGEQIRVTFFHTRTSGQAPTMCFYIGGVPASNAYTVLVGLNDATFTFTATGTAVLVVYNTAAANWANTETLVMRSYSDKYLTINFHNTCDLGDILYADGLTQTLWFESETMENTYPLEEEGVKNGEALFVRSFGRQTKKYLVRTKEMPAYMVEVFNRMKLHDTVELIDLVGDENTVYNLEVEHEWLWDDKYYAKMDLTFDYDEVFVVGGCCNNIV